MDYLVSRRVLLKKIADAASDNEGFLAFRNFVFDYYAAEDNYVFTSHSLELIFAVLLPYLQVEEAFGDSQREQRMKRLRTALEEELTPESAICALEYDRITLLLTRLESEAISKDVFDKQLKKLSPVQVDWNNVLNIYKSHLTLSL